MEDDRKEKEKEDAFAQSGEIVRLLTICHI